MSLTMSLGQFIADLSPNRLPQEAARIARMGFDWIYVNPFHRPGEGRKPAETPASFMRCRSPS